MSGTERASAVLRRVVALAAAANRALTKLAFLAAASVAAAWLAWTVEAVPADGPEWLARGVVLLAALAPPAILLLFVAGLRQVLELPERLRSLPAEVRAGALEVRDRSRRTPERTGILGAAVALVRLGRLVLGSRDLVSPYAVVAAALRPAILLAALVAAAAAIVEIPVAAVALLLVLAG